MAGLPQDLVDALTDLTATVAADRADMTRQNNMLMTALNQQIGLTNDLVTQLTAIRNAQGGNPLPNLAAPRIRDGAVNAIPLFDGNGKDHPQDFIDEVDRTAQAEGLTAAQRVQVAARRLTKSAKEWHANTGHTHATWDAWTAAFIAAFTPQYSCAEWLKMVSDRAQKANESGLAYALAKSKILRLSPITLTDAERVKFLIDGLANSNHVAAMIGNPPANFAEFITRLQTLESMTVSRPAQVLPQLGTSAGSSDISGQLSELVAQISKLTVRTNRNWRVPGSSGSDESPAKEREATGKDKPGAGASGGSKYVKMEDRKCYNCNKKGHIAKDCPSKKVKE